MNGFVVWVADVGSVKRNRFGWCRAESKDNHNSGADIDTFSKGIAEDLSTGMSVALGFECPLFVPVTDDPIYLTSARQGEGSRSWSAGAGCGALATGLTETVWIFENIRRLVHVKVRPTFNWEQFTMGRANLFIWEAFVTGKAKARTDDGERADMGDAMIAARTFWDRHLNIIQANCVTAQNPYSLVGAALLRSGLIQDIKILSEPCVVIKS